MIERKNLLIGGGILLGIYLLNPYSGSFRSHTAMNLDNQFDYQSDTLKIVNFVGKVEMTTSPDELIHIQTSNVQSGFELNFDHIAGKLEISGSEEINNTSCNGFSFFSWGGADKSDPNISINGGSTRKLSAYPILKIQAPDSVKLILQKSIIHGQFANIDSLSANLISCDKLTLNNVQNDARIEIRGSGDVEINTVGGNLNNSIRGSGNINIQSVGGSASSSIRGSGDINIGTIEQDSVSQILGSGDIHYDRISGIHKMTITGSGDIKVNKIIGDAELLVRGSGDIEIDDGELNWLIATVRGSGDIDYDGAVNNRRLSVTGSGEIDTKYD